MLYDYSEKPSIEEVIVYLIDRHRLYDELEERLTIASQSYGFQLARIDDDWTQLPATSCPMRHAIICDGLDEPEGALSRHAELIQFSTSATIAMCYSSDDAFARAGRSVDKLKARHNGKVNFLRPTRSGTRYVPAVDKIVDNAICDTVRVKYRPIRQRVNLTNLASAEVGQFFSEMSALYDRRRLFHRAPTDGFISHRCKEGGFFITCTKTNKIKLDSQRICLVHKYDQTRNELTYSGLFLPSSDSVEAAIVYESCPWVQAIVHTHASDLFTRNPQFLHKVAIPVARYGEPELGKMIAGHLNTNASEDFVIMDDHGELFFAYENDANKNAAQLKSAVEANALLAMELIDA